MTDATDAGKVKGKLMVEVPSKASETSNVQKERVLELFREFLGRRGLRITNQRLAILEACFARDDHFTAEELLVSAREIDRTVSRATVYRTLPILTESQLVKEVDVGRDYKFYIASKGQRIDQAQVVCVDCDKIYEIDAPFLEWYAKSVAEKVGLEVVSQRLQVQARCPVAVECKQNRLDCPKDRAEAT